jgi:hypothetical protein
VLTRSFPPGVVDEVIAGQGRAEQRKRLLPARLVVYYVMALALFAREGYEEVMRQLVAGLAWSTRWRGSWQVPSSPAISKARARLGPAVLAALFDRVCVLVGAPSTPGVFYRSWRLVAVDGTTFDAPDEAENTSRFGKPSHDQGKGAFPQVRVVALAECGTHAMFAAALAGITTGEQDLFRRLLGKIGPGMLVLADRNFLGYQLWAAPPRPARICGGGPSPTPGCPWSPNWPMAPTCPTWRRPEPADAASGSPCASSSTRCGPVSRRIRTRPARSTAWSPPSSTPT